MSSMYLYWARQSSEEFSALETTCMAMSFSCGAVRSAPAAVTRPDRATEACCPPVEASTAGVPAAASARMTGLVFRMDFRGIDVRSGVTDPVDSVHAGAACTHAELMALRWRRMRVR